MSDMSEGEQIARLTAVVESLESQVKGLRDDLKDQRDNFVPSSVFMAWKTGSDREIMDIKKRLDQEIADRKSQRVPAAVYVTALVGILSIGITLFLWLAERS